MWERIVEILDQDGSKRNLAELGSVPPCSDPPPAVHPLTREVYELGWPLGCAIQLARGGRTSGRGADLGQHAGGWVALGLHEDALVAHGTGGILAGVRFALRIPLGDAPGVALLAVESQEASGKEKVLCELGATRGEGSVADRVNCRSFILTSFILAWENIANL
jgi:hypothetical protein